MPPGQGWKCPGVPGADPWLFTHAIPACRFPGLKKNSNNPPKPEIHRWKIFAQTPRVASHPPLCPASTRPARDPNKRIHDPLPGNQTTGSPFNPSGRRNILARCPQQGRPFLPKSITSGHGRLFFARPLALRLPPPTRSGPAEYPTAFPLTKEPLLTHLLRFPFQILHLPGQPATTP